MTKFPSDAPYTLSIQYDGSENNGQWIARIDGAAGSYSSMHDTSIGALRALWRSTEGNAKYREVIKRAGQDELLRGLMGVLCADSGYKGLP